MGLRVFPLLLLVLHVRIIIDATQNISFVCFVQIIEIIKVVYSECHATMYWAHSDDDGPGPGQHRDVIFGA